MADYRTLEELILSESDDAALALVRSDLDESYQYKKDHWPADAIRARWRMYRGDPSSFDYGRLSGPVPQPVNNLLLLQIRHKVSKLTHQRYRLNARPRDKSLDDQTRLGVAAAKRRLEQKADEADWQNARRKLCIAAAVQSIAYRAVGVQYEGLKPVIRTWKIRPEEWHMDPAAESLDSARWCAWRRYVSSEELLDTLRRYDMSPSGSSAADLTAEPDRGITLPDDQILLDASGARDRRWAPRSRILLTDYWRRDTTLDLMYPCSKCGQQATVGRYDTGRVLRPQLECQHCGHMEKRMPDRSLFRQHRRYPRGRHIRILGPARVAYSGPIKLALRDVFPVIGMPWYETDDYPGMSETEALASPQTQNNLAALLLLHNAVANTHPKRWTVEKGITKPDNNDPFNIIEVTAESAQQGGIHQMPAGDVGPAARILLGDSKENTYLLAGNDRTATGGQPTTVRSGVGIARVNAASDIALYMPQDHLFAADTRFFRIVQDICTNVDYPERMSVVNDLTRETHDVFYEKELMRLIAEIDVTGEQDIEEEREAYFSRAVQLKTLGDPDVTWSMIHELSGIPEDYFERAREEQAAAPEAPPLSLVPGGRPAPGGAAGAGGLGAGAVRQELLGSVAPPQVRPPMRSRGQPSAQPAKEGAI